MKSPAEQMAELAAISASSNKFDQKYTHEQRCFIYILITTEGISTLSVARCFDYSVDVLNKMKSPGNARYRSIKREYKLLGRQDFLNQYFDQAMHNQFLKWQREDAVARNAEESKPNPTATRRAGPRHKQWMDDGYGLKEFAWPVWVSEDENHPHGYGWGSQWSDTPDKKESIGDKFYNTSSEAYLALQRLFPKK